MAYNKSVALLVLLAFLLLMTAPVALIFAYRGFLVAATAGLFIIPALMVFLAVIIVVVKKRGLAIPSAAVARPAAKAEPVRYPWEGMFGSEEKEYVEKRRRPIPKPHGAGISHRGVAAVVIAVIVLALVVALQQKGVFVSDANKAIEAKPAAEVKQQQNLTLIQLSAVVKKFADSTRGFGSKIKGGFAGSASKVKSAVAKVPDAAWQGIALAVLVLLFAGAVFYSRKTQQLGWISEWFVGWLGWLFRIFSYARKNKLKVLLWAIAAAVACVVIATVVFRKWSIAKFPAVSASDLADAAINVLLAVKDFISVYRLYILIGIFALLAIIGILFVYETKGKKKAGQ